MNEEEKKPEKDKTEVAQSFVIEVFAQHAKQTKRLLGIILVLIMMLVATTLGFLVFLTEYEYSITSDVIQDGGGLNNITNLK